MNPAPQSESRDETIFRYTRQMMHERNITWDVFGQQVAETYLQHVPADARLIDFCEDRDVAKRMEANGQIVKRWYDRRTTTRFPVQAEEPWVNSLMEPYRTACRRELARRYGFLAAPIPHDALTVAEGLQCMGHLSDEFAGATRELGAIIADGRVDLADREYAQRAIKSLEALIGTAISLKEQLARV